MYEKLSIILFFICIILGLRQYIASLKVSSENSSVLKRMKYYRMIIYGLGSTLAIIILFFNKTPFIRFFINIYKYIIYGNFYKFEYVGYENLDIANIINGVQVMFMAIIALFLPALFYLYTSFRKDIHRSFESLKKIDVEHKIRMIKDYEREYIFMDKELKVVSRILFFLLIFVMVCTFCLGELNDLNIKGDLAHILKTITSLVFIGYTVLLTFYHRIVIPFYKTIYKIDLEQKE